MTVVTSYCRLCIAGCGITVDVEGDTVGEVRGLSHDPVSMGYTCAKGRNLGVLHHGDDRLDEPASRLDGRLTPTPWSSTLDDIAATVARLRVEHGPHSVGLYAGTTTGFDSTGGFMTNRFFSAIGTRSLFSARTLDTPCKPLVAELVAGDPALVAHPDEARATLTIVVGTNPVISHGHTTGFADPVRRLRRLRNQGELWVVDPRETETSRLATGHLRPVAGRDHAVVAHLVRQALARHRDDDYLRQHCTGADVLAAAVERFTLDNAARWSGVPAAELTRLDDAVAAAKAVSIFSGTGTTMGPAANVTEWLIWALLIVTQSMDRPGGMWFHPGCLTCGRRRAAHLAAGNGGTEFGPPSRPELPRRLGELPAAAMVDEIEAGNLRALFVVGGNPLTSFPEPDRLRRALGMLDALVVIDIVHSSTGAAATHVLPAVGPLERADVPLRTDRLSPAIATRYSPAVVAPGPGRRPVWWIFHELATRMALPVLPAALAGRVLSDDTIIDWIARDSRVPIDELRSSGAAVVAGQIEFGAVEHGPLVDGRWQLAPEPLLGQLAALDARPDHEPAKLVLIPHRSSHRFNSSDATRRGLDEAVVSMSEPDAAERGLRPGEPVVVSSDAGDLNGRLSIDPNLLPGCITILHGLDELNVNVLTSSTQHVDELTGMVLLASVPVAVSRAGRATGTDHPPPS